MAHGGKRKGAGRKSKASEQDLIERLSPLDVYGYKALENALKDEQGWAVKLFFEYRYGRPKQVINQKNTHTITDFNLKDLLNFDNS